MSLRNKSLIFYNPYLIDLKREGVNIDWMCVLEASECSNILFLAAFIANTFIRKYIFETAVLLYLYYSITLSIYYQIIFLILCLISFQSTFISSCSAVHLAKKLPTRRYSVNGRTYIRAKDNANAQSG